MGDFSRPEKQIQTAFPVARAGYPFIYAAAFATAVFALLGYAFLALFGVAATFFICFFFRDPDRLIPADAGSVLSPADGRILSAGPVQDDRFGQGACLKVSIFMSVFNVHVNRIPYEGEIKKIDYFPGRFFSANLDKASKHNEHNAVYLETREGKTLCMVQIAGLIARRILCDLQSGDRVTRGRRFGMICFGSRVDVYIPADSTLNVSVGDKVRAGTSILGFLT